MKHTRYHTVPSLLLLWRISHYDPAFDFWKVHHSQQLPSGNLLHSYWRWPLIVDFPIKNGDFPIKNGPLRSPFATSSWDRGPGTAEQGCFGGQAASHGSRQRNDNLVGGDWNIGKTHGKTMRKPWENGDIYMEWVNQLLVGGLEHDFFSPSYMGLS